MSEFVEQLMDRPKSHKIAFWIGSIAFFTFIFWQYSYSSLLTQRDELEEKVTALEGEILNEQRLSRDLTRVREAVRELDAKLQSALQELPDKREIPGLLSSISSLAKDAGLDVNLFKPRQENFKEFYAEVPVSIQVEGTYHQVASFFDEVGRLPRIVNISEISFKDPKLTPDDGRIRSRASCAATTFRYLDESERAKAPEADSGKGKRRK
jgi:type IV pilus assembly protein PilO